jgi:hypothetical protein
MRSFAVAIALLGIITVGFLGLWLFTSRDYFSAPLAEVSLHGFGTISVPANFKLESGVWNHIPWRMTPSGEYYYYTQINIPQAVDPDKITDAHTSAHRAGRCD